MFSVNCASDHMIMIFFLNTLDFFHLSLFIRNLILIVFFNYLMDLFSVCFVSLCVYSEELLFVFQGVCKQGHQAFLRAWPST